MRYNNLKSIGLAAGALALCGIGVQAKADTMTTTTTSMTSMTPMAPVAVTGTVDHYYTDASGYVTAVVLKTTDGNKWVHFAPSLGQRLQDTYPVGSTATLYATPGAWGWDFASMDATTPAVSYSRYPYTGYDVLRSSPMTTIGAPVTSVSGKLTGYVADKDRSILAIILDHNKLVRISPEFRQDTPPNIPDGLTPLFRGSDVEAVGYPEAPRYGSLSPYESRLIPTAITVNGQSLGSRGFGKLGAKSKTLFGFNLNGIMGQSPKEASEFDNYEGYMVYEPAGTNQGAMAAPMH